MIQVYDYRSLNIPTVFVFVGTFGASLLNVRLISLHHDRAFQLLSTIMMRLEIALPVLSPLVLLIFWGMFLLLRNMGMLLDPTAAYGAMAYVPFVPVLMSLIPQIVICFRTRPGQSEKATDMFAARANNDEEMLLEQRGEGVPAVDDVSYSHGDALRIVEHHYSSIFWSELIGVIVEVMLTLPWAVSVVEFTVDSF